VTATNALGRGWSFPVRPQARPEAPAARGLDYASGADKVQQSIALILETEPGERVMRPEFGCGLRRYLMKPNTVAVRALLRHDVEAALRQFEPRIDLTSVEVLAGEDPAQVDIHIAYVHARDGRPGNLIYPFYLE
jgi:hypothetical protein